MHRKNFSKCVATFTLLIVSVTGNFALCRDQNDRDDRRDRSSQGGNSASSGGSTSSRNISTGQSHSSGQSQSSLSSDSARSFGSRNAQSVQVPSADRSSRSFSDGARNNSPGGKFFDGRGFSAGSTDNASSILRSFGGQPVARPGDGGIPNRGVGDSGAVFRGSPPGTTWIGGSNDRPSRSFSPRSNDASPVNRFSNASPQSDRSSDGTSRGGPTKGTSKEKVDSFLQLRRDDTAKPSGTVADRSFGGNVNRQNHPANIGPNALAADGKFNLQTPWKDSKKQADQAWITRFGNSKDKSGNHLRADDGAKPPNAITDPHHGIVNLQGSDGQFAKNHKLDGTAIDRAYKDWRSHASDGKHTAGADHRDWSGQWKSGDRFSAAHDIRDHWKHGDHNDRNDHPFNGDWWRRHDHHDGHHWDHFGDHHYRPYYWWNWCSAPRLTSWCAFDLAAPYYWDYGPGEYINCNDGVVYVNGVWFEPAPLYYQRTLLLAQRVPNWTPIEAARVEWLPLGVFAIARDGVADNNVLVQLAVTKDGIIGGTLFNQLTGATFPIEGTVDKQSERAVWTYTDDLGARIVMESSIFNLTQPEATGLVHYGPDNIQTIELVRLEQPNVGP